MFGLGIRTASNGAAAAVDRVERMPQASGFPVAQPGVIASDAQMQAANAQQAAAQVAGSQAPLLVNCGPGQQTLVRQVWLNGQPASQVDCLGGATASAAMYPAAQARTVSDEGDIVRDPRIVRTRQTTYRAAAPRAQAPRRSWQKTALIIGGSTAAGAGVGGIVGGKKGALIGAAVGGGASTIYEAIKRK
jgi:hypothetical protein